MDAPANPPSPPSATGPVELAPGVSVPESVLRFAFSSSRGPGGQNVNKRLTKAELRVALESLPMPPAAVERLRTLGAGRLTSEGDLLIVSDEHRSQRANREACLDRLRELIVRAKAVPKRRKATRPTRGSVQRRREAKERRSEIKSSRTRRHRNGND